MNMNHYVERELLHLETVLKRSVTTPFTVDYWIARIDRLMAVAVVPNQLLRLAQLKDCLPVVKATPLVA